MEAMFTTGHVIDTEITWYQGGAPLHSTQVNGHSDQRLSHPIAYMQCMGGKQFDECLEILKTLFSLAVTTYLGLDASLSNFRRMYWYDEKGSCLWSV